MKVAAALAHCVLVTLLAAGCESSSGPAPSGSPAYHSDGRFLRDGRGRAIILRGINIPNDYDQHGPETEVRPAAEVFHHIADSGFNAVRLVIEWYQIEAVQGVYNAAYLEMLRQHVQWAHEATNKWPVPFCGYTRRGTMAFI